MAKKSGSRNALKKKSLASKNKNRRRAKGSRTSQLAEVTSGSERSSFDPKRSRVLRRDEVTAQENRSIPKGSLSGDLQKLSTQELSDSESVQELAEEGQDLEGELIKGVEDAPEADQRQVKSHKSPAKDVPKYKDRNRL
jgi:hypothetical protein